MSLSPRRTSSSSRLPPYALLSLSLLALQLLIMVRLFLLTSLVLLGTLGVLAISFLSSLYATHISILTSDRARTLFLSLYWSPAQSHRLRFPHSTERSTTLGMLLPNYRFGHPLSLFYF